MLILDLGLPSMEALTLLKNIRKMKVYTPVIKLTERDSIKDKIKVLDQVANETYANPLLPTN